MSTLHFDSRILSNCNSSYGSLTERDIPLAPIYYEKSHAKREVRMFDKFQHFVYGVLNGIGESFLLSAQLNREMFAAQEGRVPIVISETIRATAAQRIKELEARLVKRTSPINDLIRHRIELIVEGREFLLSYLGEEIVFNVSDSKDDIEGWKRKHLEGIFGFSLPDRFPNIHEFQHLVKRRFSMEDEERLAY